MGGAQGTGSKPQLYLLSEPPSGVANLLTGALTATVTSSRKPSWTVHPPMLVLQGAPVVSPSTSPAGVFYFWFPPAPPVDATMNWASTQKRGVVTPSSGTPSGVGTIPVLSPACSQQHGTLGGLEGTNQPAVDGWVYPTSKDTSVSVS